MKKILILIVLTLFLGGCYDYNELNDLAIISGVGIDREDDKFEVTFEILSTKKEGEQSGASSTYNVSAKGKTIMEAITNNGNYMDKVPYFDHIEVVVVSEDVAQNYLEEVAEYMIRSSKFRNEMYLTVAKDASAKEVITTTSKEKPVASSFIVDLLEHSNNSSSAGFYVPFAKTLNRMMTKGQDAVTSVLNVKDKHIVLEGMALFKDFKLATIIDNKEAAVFNLLNNFKANTVLFENACQDNNKTILSVYEAKISIEPNNDYTLVTGKLNARINEDRCGYNFKENETYDILEKEFTKIIEKNMDQVLNNLKTYQSNALSIGKSYYDKYRKEYYNLWMDQEIKYDLDLKINKKGLIFEVK